MLSDDKPDTIPVVVATGRGASRTTETRDIALMWNEDGSGAARASRADMSLTKFSLALTARYGARVKCGPHEDDAWIAKILAPFAQTPQCEAWVSRPGRSSVRCTNDATRRLTIELDADLPSVLEPENTIALCAACAGRYQESNGQRILSNDPIAPPAKETEAAAEVQGVQA